MELCLPAGKYKLNIIDLYPSSLMFFICSMPRQRFDAANARTYTAFTRENKTSDFRRLADVRSATQLVTVAFVVRANRNCSDSVTIFFSK